MTMESCCNASNIIRPFNPWPGSIYRTSKPEKIEKFARIVMEGGVHCTVRRPRGQGRVALLHIGFGCGLDTHRMVFLDIMAACGQLKSSAEKKRSLVT